MQKNQKYIYIFLNQSHESKLFQIWGWYIFLTANSTSVAFLHVQKFSFYTLHLFYFWFLYLFLCSLKNICVIYLLIVLLCECVSVCSEVEDEVVFEEFKRTNLKGMAEDEDEGNVSPGKHWGMHVEFSQFLKHPSIQ